MKRHARFHGAWSHLALAFYPVMANAAASAEDGAATYGVLAQTVAAGGSLIAAAGALTLCWKGRFNWEPVDEDVPSAARKFGGLVIAVIIATMWFRFSIQRRLSDDNLIHLAIGFGIASFVGLVIYGPLIGVLVYNKTIATGRKSSNVVKIVGGLWLTAKARQAMKSGNPRPDTIGDLFAGAGFKEDLVWPRISRALAKVLFQLSYLALVAGGTCALCAIALLVASVA